MEISQAPDQRTPPISGETAEPSMDGKVVLQQRRNPAKPFLDWVLSFAIPGIGMFMEAYFIFSVGNVKPIWQEQYPLCWKVGLDRGISE